MIWGLHILALVMNLYQMYTNARNNVLAWTTSRSHQFLKVSILNVNSKKLTLDIILLLIQEHETPLGAPKDTKGQSDKTLK